MDRTGRILQLIGTFLPLYGTLLTILCGMALRKWWRIAGLLLTPLLTYALGAYFGSVIGFDGNMLFVALFGLFMLAMCLYYPLLLAVGVVLWFRGRRSPR